MTLRDRCRKFYKQQNARIRLAKGDPVEDLVALVSSEIGRAAAGGDLDESLPLCLYFATVEDRDEFVALVHRVKPNMISRKVFE